MPPAPRLLLAVAALAAALAAPAGAQTTVPALPGVPVGPSPRVLQVDLDGALLLAGPVARQAVDVLGSGPIAGRLVTADGTVVATATAVAPGPRRSSVVLDFALTPALLAGVAQRGRLLLRVEVAAVGLDAVTDAEPTALVAPPSTRFVRTGRRDPGGFGPQRITGTGRNDDLGGASGDDRVLGRAGDDRLRGGTGDDLVDGGHGADQLEGDDGDDDLRGGPGADTIIESRFGDDRLDGGDGDDHVVGGRGTDAMAGGAGDDVLDGGTGADSYDCGSGLDVLVIDYVGERARATGCEVVVQVPRTGNVPCAQGGTEGSETVIGTDGDDVCEGRGGDDDVEGAGGHDRLFGGAGNDRIFGRTGDDVLDGGDGDDELEGSRGVDVLAGGPGDDELNGGYDPDRVSGGPGDDVIISRSGGRDVVDCGPGRDVVFPDRSDVLRACESVRRR